MKQNEELSNQLSQELTNLLRLRVDAYHRNFISEVNFINDLIVCPMKGEWENNDIRIPAHAINHFIEHLNIDSIVIQHVDITLNFNFKLNYQFEITLYSIDEKCSWESIYFNYCDGNGEFLEFSDYVRLLSAIDKNKISNFIKCMQGEITFGTLKISA